MGWQDAPLAPAEAPPAQPRWMSAPLAPAEAPAAPASPSLLSAAMATRGPGTPGGTIGAIENAISIATGIGSTIVGGIAGAFDTLAHGPEQGVQTLQDVQQAGTYQPRSNAGKQIQGLLGAIPVALRALGQSITTEHHDAIPNPLPPADPTQEKHPLLRAAAETLLETGAENLPALLGARGLPKAGPALEAGAAKLAPGPATRSMIEAVMPKPDPEMLKTATMATDKFPEIQIPPDRLTPAGANARATAARETSDLLGAGGDAHEYANREAISRYAIRAVDPEDTVGRLKPETLDPAMDKAFAKVKKGYQEVGPQDGNQIGKLLDPERESVARTGTDEAVRIVDGHIKELLDKADPTTGELSPTWLQKWDSRLGLEARSATDPNLARRLADLQDIVREHIEKQASPATAADMRLGRKQYAMGVELYPIARQSGTVNSGIINNPGDILRAVTDDRNGKVRVARGAGNDLIDLAKAADLVKLPADTSTGAKAVLHAGSKAVGALSGVGPIAGRVYNKQGAAVTRMLVEKGRPAPEAPPPPLELAPQESPPAVESSAPVSPLGDLTPDWETTPGAAGPSAAGEPISAEDLHPAFDEPPVTTGRATVPAQGSPGSQIPAVPGRPDLPDTMVSGPPGETGATEATGAEMQTPEAVEARRQQSAPPPAPKAPPNGEEQAKLDEIDRVMSAAKSDEVKRALREERGRVMKDVAVRHAGDQARASAQELRAAAAQITDARIKQSMLARADKLDPPAKSPEEKAAFDAAHPRGDGGAFVAKKDEAPK